MKISASLPRLLLAVAVCLPLGSVAQAGKTNQCNAIFAAPISNLRTQVAESSMDKYIHSQMCSQKYSSASSERRAEMDVAYKVFSLGAKTGAASAQEYQDKFCSANTESSSQATFDYLQIQTVSEGAISAWTRCVELTDRGWDFEFQTPSAMTLNFRVSRTREGIVNLTGIEIHSEADTQVSCKGDKVGQIRSGSAANLAIDQNGWSMSCNRKAVNKIVNGQTYQFYPETTITVRAEGSVFAYNQPAVYKPAAPDAEVKQLRAAMDKLTSENGSLRQTVEALGKRTSSMDGRLTNAEKNIETLTRAISTK